MFTRKFEKSLIGIIVGFACCLILAGSAQSADIKMYPQRLNLNSEGLLEPVCASIQIPIPSKYTITDFQVDLSFNGVYVVSAFDITDVDTLGIVYVYFDRAVIRDFCLTAGIINEVTVGLSGWFKVTDGVETDEFSFTGTDQILVVAPGSKLDYPAID